MVEITDHPRNVEIRDERHNIYVNKERDLQRLIYELTKIANSENLIIWPSDMKKTETSAHLADQ